MRNVYLPRSIDELWRILDAEPEAAVYAGGTDLLVKLRAAASGPRCLVCIERIDELRGVADRGDSLRIGSTTTHSQLLEHALIREHLPVLALALAVLGSPPIRHMGTIGGNIVTASPAGDTLPALYVLGAELEVLSRASSRRLPLHRFITGPGAVDLRNGEILGAVWVRKQPEWTIHHHE
ncbi:MAG: FAD binding domain-containing protein, partial [Acidobacteriota bacterium]